MTWEPPYRVSEEGDELVIRIPRNSIGREQASRFLDYLVVESIRQKSELSEEDAAEIANEGKQAAWKRVRHRFEKPAEGVDAGWSSPPE